MKFIEHTAARRLAQQRIAKKRLRAEEFVCGVLIAVLLAVIKFSYDAWCDEKYKIIIKETLSDWKTTILVNNIDLLLVCIVVLVLSIYAVLKEPK